jgi:hypothetical protein
LYHEGVEQGLPADRGGPFFSRIATFLGVWRPPDGWNLRVGVKIGNSFVPADQHKIERVKANDRINVVVRQMFAPTLPYRYCTLQIDWRAVHWFGDDNRRDVAHITSFDATSDAPGSAVGLSVFRDLSPRGGLDLDLRIYAMADRKSRVIVDLLRSPALSAGLNLAGTSSAVLGMTVPYVQAAIAGLTKFSRRNFKLAHWKFGFGLETDHIPLSYGDYILLDGTMRLGSVVAPLAWSDLTWNPAEEQPKFKGSALRNPYLMFSVQRAAGPATNP